MEKTTMEIKEVTDDVFCNVCGDSLYHEYNYHGVQNTIAEFGYGSGYDGLAVDFSLCENCFVELAKKFKLPATIINNTYGNCPGFPIIKRSEIKEYLKNMEENKEELCPTKTINNLSTLYCPECFSIDINESTGQCNDCNNIFSYMKPSCSICFSTRNVNESTGQCEACSLMISDLKACSKEDSTCECDFKDCDCCNVNKLIKEDKYNSYIFEIKSEIKSKILKFIEKILG